MNNGYVNKKIVISGYCGLKGAALIAKEKYGELLSRYTPSFLKVIFKDEAGDFPAEICENAFIKESFMLEAGEGGVFNALWELYKMTGCGMEVDLFKLPITQQTIEICEFYDINPKDILVIRDDVDLTVYKTNNCKGNFNASNIKIK